MPVLDRFDPPGRVRDVRNAELLGLWSDEQSERFDDAVRRVESEVGAGRSPFYNPARVSTDAPAAERDISWPGFPRRLFLRHGANRRLAFEAAERLDAEGWRVQDEYLEWHVHRDRGTGKIVRIDFTCEGPEYWAFLAERAPRTLLSLYRRHVSPDVRAGDLRRAGAYDPLNAWNTERGAMHLTHPSNTLGAEIALAADATVLRRRGSRTLTDADELIRCAGYGVPERASDPRIGADVNALAREGYAITLANPVGLYIAGLDTQGWTRPDGRPVGDYLRIVRGTRTNALRAVYEVPARERAGGQPFVVGDISIGGRTIEFGGQVAEFMTLRLTGVACRRGQISNPPRGCEPGAAAGTMAAPAGGAGRALPSG
jgi:hypothetical protein